LSFESGLNFFFFIPTYARNKDSIFSSEAFYLLLLGIFGTADWKFHILNIDVDCQRRENNPRGRSDND